MFRIKPTEFWPGKECTHTLSEAKATIHNTNWPYRILYNLSICGLFVLLCEVEIAITTSPPCILGTVVQSLQQVAAHGGGFIMFRPIMQEEVLNVEQFCC
jgi:hypothetical protein